MSNRSCLLAALACALMFVAAQPAEAATWSNTELHLQYGSLDTPSFAGGGDKDTLIFTFQHASGWKYGDNFLFFDVLSSEDGGFNDNDTYGEWYSYVSFRKVAG
ncbi:MAG: nucleoside-binding protein, partial [bacterium]|nr:nucleoside-binding protein [bacterium]